MKIFLSRLIKYQSALSKICRNSALQRVGCFWICGGVVMIFFFGYETAIGNDSDEPQ